LLHFSGAVVTGGVPFFIFSFVAFLEKIEKRFSMVVVFQKVVYVDLDLTLKVVIWVFKNL
jgi:hypothetical protein